MDPKATREYMQVQAETDLREITRMVGVHGIENFLHLVAESFESQSEIENDDMELAAQAVDGAIEEWRDQVGSEESDDKTHNDPRHGQAKELNKVAA